jgi:hypothetical protein
MSLIGQESTKLVTIYFFVPILEEIYRLMDTFDTLVISHVYRDRNMVADSLSKDGLLLSLGQWHITEKKRGRHKCFFSSPVYRGTRPSTGLKNQTTYNKIDQHCLDYTLWDYFSQLFRLLHG